MSKSLTNRIVLLFIVTVFVYVNVAKADVVLDGLIAYYSLDASSIDGDNVTDIIGGNDGVMNNAVNKADGKIGGALEFDGEANGKVTIEGTDALNFNGIEGFTVAAWIYIMGPSGGVCCGSIIAQRDLNGWALRYDNRNGPKFVELISSPGWIGDGGDFGLEVPEKEWHHVTGVLGNGQIVMYLDGELGAEVAFPGAVVTNGGTETVLGGAGDGYFTGIIDEVLIYNKALSEAEVMQNAESTRFSAVEPGNKLAVCWGEIKN